MSQAAEQDGGGLEKLWGVPFSNRWWAWRIQGMQTTPADVALLAMTAASLARKRLARYAYSLGHTVNDECEELKSKAIMGR